MNDADVPDHTPVGKHFLVCCFTISEGELELDNQSLQHDLNYVSSSIKTNALFKWVLQFFIVFVFDKDVFFFVIFGKLR